MITPNPISFEYLFYRSSPLGACCQIARFILNDIGEDNLLQLFSQIVKQKLRSRRNILFLNWTAQLLISLCIFPGYLVRKRFGNCLHHVGGKEEEELNYFYVSAWCVRRETLLLVGLCGSFLWKCFKESTRKGKFFRKGIFSQHTSECGDSGCLPMWLHSADSYWK